ncbi:SAM-dependent methyltransferase [Bacillus cereus]|uniref:HsdM family class I SAM-dependent methyltransferase n=1 Tax=Bacillus paranthracis TaxID=2026186 RepID=UPI0002B8E7C4|nr:N-6 DNA methylase [Bacillus paranthracis]RGO16720.1 SAM-dependent methyltransferase [Bacillus cereus]
MTTGRRRVSEFTSYIYIKNELSTLGWNTKNPSRDVNGQVYTQQECLENVEIQKQLDRLKPEYVVKVNEDCFYIIEAKATIDQIDEAFTEAKDYADLINKSDVIRASIISGVAGNDEDGYLVKSAFYHNGEFRQINYHEKEITSLVSPTIANELLQHNTSEIKKLDINEEQLLKTAEEINEVLHAGSINKDERASVMATLLLALIDDTQPNYHASPTVFVKDVNNRAEEILIQHNKREFFKHIEIKLPSKAEAQNKYKKALVATIFKLKKINIKAAMNSGTDVLGKFYEVFLKYGNGAKDIGIVLTPRHITSFACEVLNVTHNDVIYDPTCGTGGFLVSGFDYVRSNSTEEQIKEFKKHRIFGVEQQPRVAALAIVNMIFRGDGSNNIIDDNCLSIKLKPLVLNSSKSAEYVSKDETLKQGPITKVLMNPPFALKDKDEKEFKFVQHALEQMEDGTLLFAVLPLSVLIKSGATKTWRKEKLLKENTLISVITFPPNLFYPVGVHTCAIIVKKGNEHPKKQNVLWLRCTNDGYLTKKGKRLQDDKTPNDLEKVKDLLKLFILNQNTIVKNIPEFQKASPINWDDKVLELVPEAYLDIKPPNIQETEEGMENLIRETVAYIIRSKKEDEVE